MKKGFSALTGMIIAVILLLVLILAFITPIRTGSEESFSIMDQFLISIGVKEVPGSGKDAGTPKGVINKNFITIREVYSVKPDGSKIFVSPLPHSTNQAYDNLALVPYASKGLTVLFDRKIKHPVLMDIFKCGGSVGQCESEGRWERVFTKADISTANIGYVGHGDGFTLTNLNPAAGYRIRFQSRITLLEGDEFNKAGDELEVNPNTNFIKIFT